MWFKKKPNKIRINDYLIYNKKTDNYLIWVEGTFYPKVYRTFHIYLYEDSKGIGIDDTPEKILAQHLAAWNLDEEIEDTIIEDVMKKLINYKTYCERHEKSKEMRFNRVIKKTKKFNKLKRGGGK